MVKVKDVSVGHRIEIIALTNPYTDDISNGMHVQILMAGQPRADVQVELFERPFNSDERSSNHDCTYNRYQWHRYISSYSRT